LFLQLLVGLKWFTAKKKIKKNLAQSAQTHKITNSQKSSHCHLTSHRHGSLSSGDSGKLMSDSTSNYDTSMTETTKNTFDTELKKKKKKSQPRAFSFVDS